MVEETILFSPLLFYANVCKTKECKAMQVYAKLCLYDTDTDTVTESATQREKENKNKNI